MVRPFITSGTSSGILWLRLSAMAAGKSSPLQRGQMVARGIERSGLRLPNSAVEKYCPLVPNLDGRRASKIVALQDFKPKGFH
jgi:hypothetical protein